MSASRRECGPGDIEMIWCMNLYESNINNFSVPVVAKEIERSNRREIAGAATFPQVATGLDRSAFSFGGRGHWRLVVFIAIGAALHITRSGPGLGRSSAHRCQR